ncbi:Retrovirus-related Pol polyprotein from transposon TNT 1-94 [Vitis vinifera]|uniref:Retrovirus-related Pol polyprotein from transposon TNT 1-94 n=1 Tax=Vitis vinifera TaxID=29760 RepID=A0A438H3L5_VITVI|nr:Retrovirus-related Pol polyprotein from transposon TNT 1-94 [Vitis vinifera]
MDKIPYPSAVGRIMYAQVCTRPDIAYVVGMLGRYQSNSGIDHWKAVKKVLRYLQGTKDYMLTYKRTDNLEIIGYSDSDYAGCKDTRKSTSRPGFSSLNEASTSKCSNSTLIGQANMEDLEAAPTKSICICTSLGGWNWLSQNSSLTSLIISSRLLYGPEDCTFLQYLLVSHLACVEPWL